MMKGIVFTLDALFALIIAVASISIILYFFYTPVVSYSYRYGEAATILNMLENTNISQLSNSSALASQINYLSNPAFATTWPQLMDNANNNAGAPFGITKPFVAFLFSAQNKIQTGVAAGFGNAYFGAGNYLYAVNVTTGLKSWVKNEQSEIEVTPVIYNDLLIFSNTTNITAVNPLNGNPIWSTNAIQGI
ncbi:MAG: hypothetical protein ACP5RT_00565, partial [Candidatus Micrarchaeia archaeon]